MAKPKNHNPLVDIFGSTSIEKGRQPFLMETGDRFPEVVSMHFDAIGAHMLTQLGQLTAEIAATNDMHSRGRGENTQSTQSYLACPSGTGCSKGFAKFDR